MSSSRGTPLETREVTRRDFTPTSVGGPEMAPHTPHAARDAPGNPWRPSITRHTRWGSRNGPTHPHRLGTPGGAVAPLDHPWRRAIMRSGVAAFGPELAL